ATPALLPDGSVAAESLSELIETTAKETLEDPPAPRHRSSVPNGRAPRTTWSVSGAAAGSGGRTGRVDS
ncbi:hypothetical protein AB0H25_33830, partial [Actinosynnema sp. NPDC023926]